MNSKEITSYPDSTDATSEAMEKPQPSESVLDVPKGNMGATSPKDDDSQWDLPCGCKADPSPTM